jgi:hypothetical protein
MSQLPQSYLLRLWREHAEQHWRVTQNDSWHWYAMLARKELNDQ